jgi:hypothetical protein
METRHLGVNEMIHTHNSSHACPHSGSRLIRHDLCAQLAPLNTYGLADFSSSLVDGLIALAGASRKALHRSAGAGAADVPRCGT